MKKLNLILILFIVGLIAIKSQECKVYIPGEVGTEVQLSMYDKKDKLTNIITQKLTNIRKSGDTTIYNVHQINTDEKGKNMIESFSNYKCLGEDFYLDMNTYLNQQQMEAYKDMQFKLTTSDISFPSTLSEGQTLKDGFVKMEFLAGAMPMVFSANIYNIKVEAFESVTTPAGTFECVKISEDFDALAIFMKITGHSVFWYSEAVGTVKSENYDKNMQLTSKMVLTKITKP